MDRPRAVGVLGRAGDLPHQPRGFGGREQSTVDPVGERHGGEVFHDVIRLTPLLAHGQDRHDVGTAEVCGNPGLIEEPGSLLTARDFPAAQELDGRLPTRSRLGRDVDPAAAAPAQQAEVLITGDRRRPRH